MISIALGAGMLTAIQCLHASTALLSSPLPGSTVLPARLAPFIMKLVHQMVQNPCAGTIRPLYEVFSGLHDSPGLLDAVPEEAMASFQTECSKILRNLDDHMGNLLCLATFARIASTRRYYAAPDRREDRLPAWLQNVSQFFGPKRGLKTLDLVVLRVVLACSASCSGLSPAEAVESVRLAVEICDRVGFEQRESWIKSNPSRIAKLCEKVSRDGIDPELQMMVFISTPLFAWSLLTWNRVSHFLFPLYLQPCCQRRLDPFAIGLCCPTTAETCSAQCRMPL